MRWSLLVQFALAPEEAARVAGLGRGSIFAAIRSGRLPARKAGRRTLILASDLKRFLADLPLARTKAEAV